MILASIFSPYSFAKDFPMQCDYDHSAARAEERASKADKQKLDVLAIEVRKLWGDLQKVITTPDFRVHGLNANTYKKWAEKYNPLKDRVNELFKHAQYCDTNYEKCYSALTYSVNFQEDYARAKAIYGDDKNVHVIKAKNELMQFIRVLPNKK